MQFFSINGNQSRRFTSWFMITPQIKLVRTVCGSGFDVPVDLRIDSKNGVGLKLLKKTRSNS